MDTLDSGLPQSPFLGTQLSSNRSRIRTTVFTVLAAHALLLVVLLIQGCKHGSQDAETAQVNDDQPSSSINGAGASTTPEKTSPSLDVPGKAASKSAAALTGKGTRADDVRLYAVKSGDTLSTIARAYGTTPKAIRAANGLNADRLMVGQKLRLPES